MRYTRPNPSGKCSISAVGFLLSERHLPATFGSPAGNAGVLVRQAFLGDDLAVLAANSTVAVLRGFDRSHADRELLLKIFRDSGSSVLVGLQAILKLLLYEQGIIFIGRKRLRIGQDGGQLRAAISLKPL